MKNNILLSLILLIPYIALADTITEIKELRSKIKETSEEYRIVCEGSVSGHYGRNAYKIGDSKKYCKYLEDEVSEYIKELEKLTDNYENV